MASSSNGNAIDKATLGALPNEILTKICQNLEPQFISRLHGMWHPYNYDALHALCLVKRRFRDVAQQHLYTTVQIMDTNVVHLLRTFLSREDLAGRVKAAHIKIAANTWDGYNCSDPADTLAVHEAFVRSGINLVHWMVACSESGGSPEMALTQLLIGSMPNLQHLETLHPFVPALTSSVQGGQKFMFSEKLTSLSIRARSTVYSDVTDPTFLESILVASKVRRLNIENLHESAANLGLREKYSSVRELNLFDPHLRLDHGLLLQHFPGLQSLTLTGTAASYRLMAYQWDPVSQWCEIFKSTSTLINLRYLIYPWGSLGSIGSQQLTIAAEPLVTYQYYLSLRLSSLIGLILPQAVAFGQLTQVRSIGLHKHQDSGSTRICLPSNTHASACCGSSQTPCRPYVYYEEIEVSYRSWNDYRTSWMRVI